MISDTFLVLFCVLFLSYYLYNKFQKKHTILRNYPIIGAFRYILEDAGPFLRQYFFSMDREEKPFNRADRQFVYRAAKNIKDFVSFGSTASQSKGGVFFSNSLIPTLEEDTDEDISIRFGLDNIKHPYTTNRLYHVSGMSYGAISKNAVKALSMGAEKSGCWLNTGEGGLSKYHLKSNADLVFQIGTAKYGVRNLDGSFSITRFKAIAANDQVKMFEVKLSQGAKPGKGGILPKNKITPEIAEIRGIELGKDSISPNRHEEFTSVEDILDFVKQLRDASQKPVGVKMVAGDEYLFDDFFEVIKKKGVDDYAPDFITVDGSEGGTGASPSSLMDGMGLSIKEALPLLVDSLKKHGLRERIKVVASGALITPLNVSWALAVGADCVVSARGFMFALGCIQALKCATNECPTGIATHDKKYTDGLNSMDKGERVANYVNNMHKQLFIIARSCGLDNPSKLERRHCRIYVDDSKSVSLNNYYDKNSN